MHRCSGTKSKFRHFKTTTDFRQDCQHPFCRKECARQLEDRISSRPGDILNLRQGLEQGLEQMKRLPFRDVDFQLVPGKNPGESDVVITMKTIDSYETEAFCG